MELKRKDIHRRVHGAFATALYQDRAYQLQSQILQNTDKVVAATQARVDAGDALRDDLARVEMERARATVDQQRAESLRRQSLVGLVSAIGDPTLAVNSLDGTLDATFDIPTLEELAANLSAQPEALQARRASEPNSLARISPRRSEFPMSKSRSSIIVWKQAGKTRSTWA